MPSIVKTLRITSIVAVVVSAVFFVFPAVFGARSDEQIEQFLNLPSAIEKFNRAKDKKAPNRTGQTSPLVTQAEAFALYLNPPPEPPKQKAKATAPKKPQLPRPKAKVSAKFKPVATCFYASRPELSLALIDEPGKGSHWVKPSSKVGHLIIEQIKDGMVVVRDGDRTFELNTPSPPKQLSLLKASSAGHSKRSEKSTPAPVKSSEETARYQEQARPSRSPKETALMAEFVNKLKASKEQPNDGQQETGEMIKNLISSIDSIHSSGPNTTKPIGPDRISSKEAKRLGRLGKQLKHIRSDPNQTIDRSDKTENGSREPNHPEE